MDNKPFVCPNPDRVNMRCLCYIQGDCECEAQDRLAEEIEQQEREDAESMRKQETEELNWLAHQKGYPFSV